MAAALELQPGPAAFYGTVGIEPLFRQARASGADWYYLDNSWFDATRGTHFRVTRNALQLGRAMPDYARWRQVGRRIEPWRKAGRHVLVVHQSEHFMAEVANFPAPDWQAWVLKRVRQSTDRPIVVRHWSRDKAAQMASLQADLINAWCVVAHSSAAAIEAVLSGVPVFLTTSDCAAAPMGSSRWDLERPAYHEHREQWAAELAARQWALDELRDGTAWRRLHE